jgi:voltage-gated potassium channel
LKDHVIICGYGSKGRAAARTLLGRGVERDKIVVIDNQPEARRQATAAGFATVAGSAAAAEVLADAGVRDARAVIVAPHRDDASVLITLTARELNPNATIVASVREEENVHLLHQSGASSVITSSGAAGRLLGFATETPRLVEVLEDLLSVGEGLDVTERVVGPHELGPLAGFMVGGPVIAVIRNGEVLRFDDRRAVDLEEGDRVVHLRSHPAD